MPNESAVRAILENQRIEIPPWAHGNSGTRSEVFRQSGVARTPHEKLEDAARGHAHTGVAPSVAPHIPRDRLVVERQSGTQAGRDA